MGGNCHTLAAAIKSLNPDWKVAAAFEAANGRSPLLNNHVVAWDPQSGRAFDGRGWHDSPQAALSSYRKVNLDASPQWNLEGLDDSLEEARNFFRHHAAMSQNTETTPAWMLHSAATEVPDGSSHLAVTKQSTVHVEQVDDMGDYEADEINPDGTVRQPFIYHAPSQTVFLGHPGMYHGEIEFAEQFKPHLPTYYNDGMGEAQYQYHQGQINHTPYGSAVAYGGYGEPDEQEVQAALTPYLNQSHTGSRAPAYQGSESLWEPADEGPALDRTAGRTDHIRQQSESHPHSSQGFAGGWTGTVYHGARNEEARQNILANGFSQDSESWSGSGRKGTGTFFAHSPEGAMYGPRVKAQVTLKKPMVFWWDPEMPSEHPNVIPEPGGMRSDPPEAAKLNWGSGELAELAARTGHDGAIYPRRDEMQVFDPSAISNIEPYEDPERDPGGSVRQGAADPTWWSEYLRENPYLYHFTRFEPEDEIARRNFKERGIVPWDTPLHDAPGSIYDGSDYLTPRSGHVYLSPDPNFFDQDENVHRVIIDASQLDPSRLNPDEDAGITSWMNWATLPGYQNLTQPPEGGAYSRGQWAEDHRLTDPEMVKDSLGKAVPSIAYRGSVPPEAIRAIERWDGEPQSQSVLAGGSLEDPLAITSAETSGQASRRWEALLTDKPSAAQVVHTFPDGSTVQQLGSAKDAQRVGEYMRNCWQGAMGDPLPEDWRWRHTINDPEGKPTLAFHVENDHSPHKIPGHLGIHSPLGMRNSNPEEYHRDLLRQWGEAVGQPVVVGNSEGFDDLDKDRTYWPDKNGWTRSGAEQGGGYGHARNVVDILNRRQAAPSRLRQDEFLNWTPGSPGKGFVDSLGTLVTWNTSEEGPMGRPHHIDQAAEHHGVDWRDIDAGGYKNNRYFHSPITIAPDGVYTNSLNLNADAFEHYPTEEEYRFAQEVPGMVHDPDSDAWADKYDPDMQVRPQGFGHGRNVMDILDKRGGSVWGTVVDPQYMYHVAPREHREAIQQQGLRPNMSGGFSEDSDWAHEHYGGNPIYLSREPGRSADTVYDQDGKDLWKVDVTGHPITADLPGLYDNGGRVDDGGMWWEEGYEPKFPMEDPDGGWTSFESLLGEHGPGAIDTTQTAATMAPIGPERLQLVSPDDVTKFAAQHRFVTASRKLTGAPPGTYICPKGHQMQNDWAEDLYHENHVFCPECDQWYLNPLRGFGDPETDMWTEDAPTLFDPRRLAMAADPSFIQQWIEKNGPYLYHGTGPENVESIQQHGIQPDRAHNWSDEMATRPGHVYMATRPRQFGHNFRVDLRKLDPANLTADEDAFWEESDDGNYNLMKPEYHEEFGNPSINPWLDPEDNDYPSWGAWADRAKPDSPEHTQYSLEEIGTLAHRGTIPPEAIELHEPGTRAAALPKEEYENPLAITAALADPAWAPFTGQEFGRVQRRLYDSLKANENRPDRVEEDQGIIDALDGAISEQEPLSEDMTLYHGGDIAGRLDEDGVNPGYLSTTGELVHGDWMPYGPVNKVVVPAGSRVLHVPSVLGRDPHSENETILPRGSQFDDMGDHWRMRTAGSQAFDPSAWVCPRGHVADSHTQNSLDKGYRIGHCTWCMEGNFSNAKYTHPDYPDDTGNGHWSQGGAPTLFPPQTLADPEGLLSHVSSGNLQEDLNALIGRYELVGVDLHAFITRAGGIKVGMISSANQGQGLASGAIKELTDLADRYGVPIALTPGQPEGGSGGLSNKQLKDWYGRNGFVPNKGRNKDFAYTDAMIRPVSSTSPFREVVFPQGQKVWVDDDNDAIYDDPNHMDPEDGTHFDNWIYNQNPYQYMHVPNFNEGFWEQPEPMFHSTEPENVEAINTEGLRAMNKTRGLTNRGIGGAVFTHPDIHTVSEHYGGTPYLIDTQAMKDDGYMPEVSMDGDYDEKRARESMAHHMGFEDFYEDPDYGGEDDRTVVFHGDIPPKYIQQVDQYTTDVSQLRREAADAMDPGTYVCPRGHKSDAEIERQLAGGYDAPCSFCGPLNAWYTNPDHPIDRNGNGFWQRDAPTLFDRVAKSALHKLTYDGSALCPKGHPVYWDNWSGWHCDQCKRDYDDREVSQALSLFDAHVAMALNPVDRDRWIAENGPYLEHWTTAERVPSILQQGIQPSYPDYEDDMTGEVVQDDNPANWTGFLQTRPGHTYLAPPGSIKPGMHVTSEGYQPYQVPVRVDLRKLDPTKLKADEDVAQKMWPEWAEAQDPDVREEMEVSGPPDAGLWDAESQGLGDWAEYEGLDEEPWTLDSLNQGSLAHEGPIPPEAISLHPDHPLKISKLDFSGLREDTPGISSLTQR